ncbi:MBL fold metallo-hydrolase [Anaeromyxobacter oryzisoli]|uniref:MBL fold metallo-hydrolase n=1 Tax=Anaeromyxobacter oryzisoli TaxID=2925408 RepID=UPI001F561CDB|nr:MBL fold metallo-hydrolase [Anaeromyxobacter sp. SG63]
MSFVPIALPPAPPPAEPVIAAAVILHREGPRGREAVLVRRGKDLRFAGGWHAFPGGRLDPEDRAIPVAGAPDPEAAALVACAHREVFEETGVLLARGRERLGAAARTAARRALLDGSLGFGAFVARSGLALDARDLLPAGRWITPEHLPLRYDARLFLAALPAGEVAEIWPGELADGGLRPVADVLAAWSRGEVLLHPPNLNAVRTLARPGPVDLDALRDPPHCAGFVCRRIEFQEGFFLAALRTPTLPPATHTNCWLVPDGPGLAVIDPGAPDPAEQAILFELVDGLAAEGRPPTAIWVTHCHPDHTGAVAALAARHRLPVRAHPRAAGRIRGVENAPLREGERLGDRFRVLETPGHAPEHLAFLDERTGALLCGDLVSTLSTIVIDPPEGDMAEYERQLARVEALGPRTLYPAHGPPAPDAVGQLAAYRAHRREREALVVAALAEPAPLAIVTARAYADTPPVAHPIAARSCLAVLLQLEREGRARRDGELWRAA